MSETKLHLKQNEVIRLEIPQYYEISVKYLYDDAMAYLVVAKYLSRKEQLSNKLPEKDFFFGVLCTVRKQCMQDIIADVNSKRFKPSDDD